MFTNSSKPKSMQHAVTCLWLSTGLAAAMTVLYVVGVIATDSVVLTAVTGVITVAILALVAAKVSSARGWARWLFLVLYVLGSFISVLGVLLAPQVFFALPALSQGSTVLQFLLQTVALVLMFTKASRDWFKTRAVPEASAL